jgi:hypothetical protein
MPPGLKTRIESRINKVVKIEIDNSFDCNVDLSDGQLSPRLPVNSNDVKLLFKKDSNPLLRSTNHALIKGKNSRTSAFSNSEWTGSVGDDDLGYDSDTD